MYVFVARPFGVKNDIDFDRIEEVLIQPAIQALNLSGGTTGLIARAGNIREETFAQLVRADIVIADISVHDANVFYELGVRHALRDKRTVLIRSSSDNAPFDLQTDGYLVYDKNNPADSVDRLVEMLRYATRSMTEDSPIFRMLPNLQPQNWTRLVAAPRDFLEEVKTATDEKRTGDLGMLATESEWFDWAPEGLRCIGRAQVDLKAYENARNTWAAVRARVAGDAEADSNLRTIDQQLDELAKSDVATDRICGDGDVEAAGKRSAGNTEDNAVRYVLIFTGHCIDKPGRTPPRFPASQEGAARDAIRAHLVAEQQRVTVPLLGIAGGASGGDILFHEVCAELSIPTRLYLAIPSGEYIAQSVAASGPEWVDRFHAIEARSRPRVLSPTIHLPRWLEPLSHYTIWQRSNLWMLHNALAYGGKSLTMIALWNGEDTGPGGILDVVNQAKAHGAKPLIVHTEEVLTG